MFSSLETSCDAVLAKGVGLLGKAASCCLAWDKRAANDAAFGPPREEGSLQTWIKAPHAKREHLDSPEGSLSTRNVCTSHSFLKKLWDIVESQLFSSTWCRHNGKHVAIQEGLFKYFCTSKERTPLHFSKRKHRQLPPAPPPLRTHQKAGGSSQNGLSERGLALQGNSFRGMLAPLHAG